MLIRKTITVYEGKLQMCAEILASETKASVECVLQNLEDLFKLAKESGYEGDNITFDYIADIPDEFPDGLVLEKLLEDKEYYMEAALPTVPYQQPQYVSKLHPYKKHESHGKPNYWHRIRSNPRQR